MKMSDLPSQLAKRILPCQECEKLGIRAARTVRTFVKPCAEFDIYAERKPSPVKVLFLAEAPPGNSKGYFYDPAAHAGYKEILRKIL